MEACALQVQLITYAVYIAASLRIHAVMSSLIFLGFSFFFKVDDVDGLRLFFFLYLDSHFNKCTSLLWFDVYSVNCSIKFQLKLPLL